MKIILAAALVGGLFLTGCAQHGLAVYVSPQAITAENVTSQVVASGPQKVRLSVEFFHNGEQQPDATIPFTPYAKSAIDALKAFDVVDEGDAPELRLTLRSMIDSDNAMNQTMKSAVSAGFAAATFHRDWTLEAELFVDRSRPIKASNQERFTVTTRSDQAPKGSVPLGAVEGYHAIYDALIYPTMSRLIAQMNN